MHKSERLQRRQEKREHFAVTQVAVNIAGLPERHAGLRIAHLSDVHVGTGTPDGRVRRAVAAVNQMAPDLVAITGDLVSNRWLSPAHKLSLLGGITAPTVVTLGNHDHWAGGAAVRRAMEDLGYLVLQNSHHVLEVRGEPLVILGIDDAWTGHDDVFATLRAAPKAATRVVLSHIPSLADDLPGEQEMVCLAGHTHGGQVVVPGLTRGILRLMGQPYMAGLYRVKGNWLYVNRGLGFGRGGPPRFRSPPEVAVITLRHPAQAAV